MDLKKFIQKSGLKQNKIAEMLGVHQNQVSRWTRGEQMPQGSNFIKLKKLMDSFNNSTWSKRLD